MELAREWRDATRWAFRETLKAGFVVAEFCRSIRGQQGPGAYLLQRGTVSDLVPEAQKYIDKDSQPAR
jgi:predicted GNAT superfamily acetyltransferase